VGQSPDASAPSDLRAGDHAELEIAVLVYDLPADTIDSLLGEVLARLLDSLQVSWTKQAYFDRR
jgi:hypothetical protein